MKSACPTLLLLALLEGAFSPGSHVLAGTEEETDKARITGIVVDAGGHGVAAVEVRVIDADLEPVRTDDAGHFSIQLDQCSVEACLVARDADGARMGLWQTLRNGVTLVPRTAEVRIVLRPSVPVKVEVVDAKLAPVPDARVVAMHSEWFPVATAQTDAAGSAILSLPDTADLTHIFAMKAGVGFDYMENFMKTPTPLADPPPANARLILQQARPLRLKAIGASSAPVQDVDFMPSYVQMVGKKASLSLRYAARAGGLVRTTDATGTATCDFLPACLAWVRFSASSAQHRQHESIYWSAPQGVAAEVPANFTSVMVRIQTLSGKVLLPDGNPAAGVMVKISGPTSQSGARTRTDGSFVLRVASERSYLLGVVDEKWAARSLTGLLVKEGHDCKDLMIRLCPGTLLSGTVRDVATGKCQDHSVFALTEFGAKIDPASLLGSSSNSSLQETLTRWVETDTEGRYSIRLGPGEYKIYLGRDNLSLSIEDQPEMQRDFSIDGRE